MEKEINQNHKIEKSAGDVEDHIRVFFLQKIENTKFVERRVIMHEFVEKQRRTTN